MSTLPSPGAPISPVPIEPAPPRAGCGRGALVGCGVALLLVLVVVGLFVVYARRKPEVFTDLMMSQVESHLAPDVTAEEKERLRASYARFRKRLEDRRFAPEPFDRLREILSSSAPQGISREKVRELTEVFEAASRSAPGPVPAGSPGAVPTFSPTP